jgi:hypothetical protein
MKTLPSGSKVEAPLRLAPLEFMLPVAVKVPVEGS